VNGLLRLLMLGSGEMISLTSEQISDVVLQEIEFQLTIMKQYLSVEQTKAYLLLLERYGTIVQRDAILEKYRKAWGDTLDVRI
jgi:DNA-binding winged helix-turn-helix (wHTH) protein